MNIPVRIGMDTSKSVFQLHGVDQDEVVVVRRQFRRAEMIRYFERLHPVLVAIESCGSSHHWARLLQSFGHEVKLIPPQYVKSYVKRGKNDATDAEALCEAVTRPSMRFVPVKSKEPLQRHQGPAGEPRTLPGDARPDRQYAVAAERLSGYAALIVRNTPDGRELTMARWGMPSPVFALLEKKADPGVTNI